MKLDLNPINDLAKIELETNEYGFGDSEERGAESGILVALPESLNYFGMWSFAFEDSLLNEAKLKKLLDHYKKLIGKRVYWTALAEKGNIIKKGKKRYAFVKLTSLISADEPDAEAYNVHSDGGGSFKA